MENKKESLTAKSFLKKLIGFSMASWVSAAISFLITPLFTRLFSPDEVGHINMFTTYMTFFQTFCVFALDQAFMRFYNEPLEGIRKDNFLTYCIRLNLLLFAFSSLAILIGYRYFSVQISGSINLYVPICLIITVFCSMFLRMTSISSRMEGHVANYTLQILSITIVEKVICTLIAFYRPLHTYAIGAICCGYFVTAVTFFCVKRKKSLRPVKRVPRGSLQTILRFSVPYLPVLLLSWFNSSIPLLVLRHYVDYASIGVYTNAVAIANILTIIQTGFTAYWTPFIYENYKTNHEKIQKIEKCMVFIIILSAMIIVLFQDVVYLLVGKEFRGSKEFFPLLMMTPICNAIGDMTGIGIMLSKKSYLNIFTFSASVSVNLLTAFLLVPHIGVLGAGIAVAASFSVMLLVRSLLGGKYYRISKRNGFILFSILLFLGVAVNNIVFSDQLLLRSAITITIIALLCICFRKQLVYLFRFALSLIQSIFHKKTKTQIS